MLELQQTMRELRRKMGWAQEDVAREIGVSLSTVQRWERREVKPNRLARKALAKLFQEAGVGEFKPEG